MSKGLKVICVLLAVVLVVGGGFLAYLLTSPQYALSGMVKEVNANGLTAIEQHLTGSALTAYQKVYSVVQNPIVEALLQTTPAQSVVSALSSGAGSLKASYQSVKRGWGTASITLLAETPMGSGNVQLEMKRNGLSWMIEDVAIPIGSWTFGN